MSWFASLFGAKKEVPEQKACHDGVCAMPVKGTSTIADKSCCGESCDCCDEESDVTGCCDDCEECGTGEAEE